MSAKDIPPQAALTMSSGCGRLFMPAGAQNSPQGNKSSQPNTAPAEARRQGWNVREDMGAPSGKVGSTASVAASVCSRQGIFSSVDRNRRPRKTPNSNRGLPAQNLCISSGGDLADRASCESCDRGEWPPNLLAPTAAEAQNCLYYDI